MIKSDLFIVLSQFVKSNRNHWNRIKQIFKYLKKR